MKERMTKQKQLVMDVLQSGIYHPSIEEIYDKAVAIDSSIGKATIYRNVHSLVKQGLLNELILSDGVKYYDINTIYHVHFYCVKCHTLEDIFDPSIPTKLKKIGKDYSFSIKNSNLILEGICKNCGGIDEV